VEIFHGDRWVRRAVEGAVGTVSSDVDLSLSSAAERE